MNALKVLETEMKVCRRCLTAGYEIVPGAIFSHPPGAQVMLIGQAPGVTEVSAQRPFNAGSGRRLFQWLSQVNWSEDEFRATVAMSAITKCYPGKATGGKGDRVPSKAEQAFCRPFLEREIALIKPRLIILVGGLAIKHLYPAKRRLDQIIGTAVYWPVKADASPSWPFDWESGECVDRLDPQQIQPNRWVVPLPHPSGASLWPNKAKNKALISRAVRMIDQIRTAISA